MKTTGLDLMIKMMKEHKAKARVGILGSKNVRGKNQGPGMSNSEIGAIHEFGSPSRGIPQRSFLRIPISEHLSKRLASSGAFDKKSLNDAMAKGTFIPWLKKVAVLAEGIVGEAFATGGFGAWPEWKDPNYQNNANQLLVDTQQLRNSITSEVK